MKKFLLLLLIAFLTSCVYTKEKVNKTENVTPINPEEAKTEINTILENWHKAAAEANFDGYFDLMTSDGIFIGTDAKENWGKEEFKEFSKPYFDRGTAWNFSTLERNIYIAEYGETAWFDELLDTWMGICRGSGVVTNENGDWRIKHYVLSVAVPNEDINEVVAAKKERDSILISKFK